MFLYIRRHEVRRYSHRLESSSDSHTRLNRLVDTTKNINQIFCLPQPNHFCLLQPNVWLDQPNTPTKRVNQIYLVTSTKPFLSVQLFSDQMYFQQFFMANRFT
jgi:hypothetical protein